MNIFLYEPDEETRETLAGYLETLGHKVHIFKDKRGGMEGIITPLLNYEAYLIADSYCDFYPSLLAMKYHPNNTIIMSTRPINCMTEYTIPKDLILLKPFNIELLEYMLNNLINC